MHGIKQIIHTDHGGGIVDLPALPANARIEATFRLVTDAETSEDGRRRRPSSRIAGKGRIVGDLIRPISDAEDWESNR
ncbi:hypothetical protein [Thiohalocapsa sp. ML1]|jgi:hypothetical protein|uniref:hypothetical protein n=1 Tax=Thiohalocapsa sp. ML1 TaxID=1431688 RepID=UPI0007323FF6|nr:hypothetical protein [Thiohalocapsa sp. ML1]